MYAKEAGQGDCRKFLAAAHDAQNPFSDARRSTGDLRSHNRGPVGFLVPGQQVTCEAEADRDQQQANTGKPGHFTGELVRAQEDHPDHVQDSQDDHGAGAIVVQAANEPTGRHLGGDILDAVIGLIWGRNVVDR